MTKPISEQTKKVTTRDAQGRENGWLMEMFKDKDTGIKTEVYLTAASPGAFKGYHLHRIRAARYVCLKGTMRISTYAYDNGAWRKSETMLTPGMRMFIPKETATGLENVGDEEAWLVNYPDPAYDPNLKDEQVEYALEELEKGIIK